MAVKKWCDTYVDEQIALTFVKSKDLYLATKEQRSRARYINSAWIYPNTEQFYDFEHFRLEKKRSNKNAVNYKVAIQNKLYTKENSVNGKNGKIQP